MPKAAILSTGTEILQGLYPDTNAQWLSARLAEFGIDVTAHMAAPDHPRYVADALRHLLSSVDIVLMTGGLGPTEDDLNRNAIAEVFGCGLKENKAAWRRIEKRFALRSKGDPPRSNRVQCLIPDIASIMQNDWGTAPGFIIESKQGTLVAMPGPPRENRPMFDKYVAKMIAKKFSGGRSSRVRTLHTFGISESKLNDMLHPLFAEYNDGDDARVAFLAGQARVDVRLTAFGKDKPTINRHLNSLISKVKRRLPLDHLYGTDNDTLESVLLTLMKKRGLTLSLAESCTGGLIAKRLTDIPGSSAVLKESTVTYSNEAKMQRLGVRKATLEKHGAVSPQVARQMALGSLKSSDSDIAVSVTGIAGPGGGSKEKPVGLVYYAIAWRSDTVDVAGFDEAEAVGKNRVAVTSTCFTSGREIVRLFASHRALDLPRRLLKNLPLSLDR